MPEHYGCAADYSNTCVNYLMLIDKIVNVVSRFQRCRLTAGALLIAGLFMSFPAAAGAYDDFFRAVKIDNQQGVKELLQRGFDPNSIEEARAETGLILALREQSMGAFRVLLDAPGVNLDIKARNGDTALMIAAYQGNLPAVQELLERNAAVNHPGWTALHYAAANGDQRIVQHLLDRYAYIDAESPNKTTPVMMAARNGHIFIVKLLLDQGADATLRNEQEMTAIDMAVKFGHKDIAEGLTARLQRAGKFLGGEPRKDP